MMNKPITANGRVLNPYKIKGLYTLRKNLTLLFLCIPAIIFIFIFSYIPMFGIIIAFKDVHYDTGILGSAWVGFKNFKFFFTSQDAWRVTRNTILYSMAWMSLGTVVSVSFALMMYEIRKKILIKTYQTAFFFPYFVSWIVAAYMLYSFLNYDYGILNGILKEIGLPAVQWYGKAEYWPLILTVMSLWKSTGYLSIIYYAVLVGIDNEYFEAAVIDGANKLQVIFKISIPFLVPMIIIMLLMSLGNIIRADFSMFYFLPRNVSLLYPTTDVIDTHVYRSLIETGDIGMSSAIGLYQSLVGFCLVVVSNTVVKKINPENSLF